jgi:hypothetical protein
MRRHITAILLIIPGRDFLVLVTRVAAVALTHTGMLRQAARFQARSAFSGTGFPATESEQALNRPVRRRIALILMLFGNAGIVPAVSSPILAFARSEEELALEIETPLLVAGICGRSGSKLLRSSPVPAREVPPILLRRTGDT